MSDLGWIAVCGCIVGVACLGAGIARLNNDAEMARAGLVQKQNDRGVILWVKP